MGYFLLLVLIWNMVLHFLSRVLQYLLSSFASWLNEASKEHFWKSSVSSHSCWDCDEHRECILQLDWRFCSEQTNPSLFQCDALDSTIGLKCDELICTEAVIIWSVENLAHSRHNHYFQKTLGHAPKSYQKYLLLFLSTDTCRFEIIYSKQPEFSEKSVLRL